MPKILLIFILILLTGCAAPKKEAESNGSPQNTALSIPENYKDI